MSENDSQRLIVASHAAVLLSVSWFLKLEWHLSSYAAYRASWAVSGILVGQISLIAIWSALSRHRLLVRSLGLVVLVPALAASYSHLMPLGESRGFGWWFSDSYTPARYLTWVAALGEMSLLVFLGLSIIRWFGYRLGTPQCSRSPTLHRFQFTVSYLLAWITYLAVLCAAWNWLCSTGWSARGILANFRNGAHLPPAEFAGFAIASSLLLLSRLPLRYALPCLLLFTLTFSCVDAHLLPAWIRDDIFQPLPWSVYFCSYAAFGVTTWLTLLGVRHRGYRMVWRPDHKKTATNAT